MLCNFHHNKKKLTRQAFISSHIATFSLNPVTNNNYSLIPGNLTYSLAKHTYTQIMDFQYSIRANFPSVTMLPQVM